jgi:hypothetical protein
MVLLTIALTSLLCLAFRSTRLIGVVGMALLFLLQPLPVLALAIIGGAGYYLFIHQSTSKE